VADSPARNGKAPRSSRVARPTLERDEPLRSLSSFIRAPASKPSPSNGSGASRADDVIGRSVAAGYRVLDEHVRQGQRAARALSGEGDAPSSGPELSKLTERMFQHAQDLAAAWLDMMSRVMSMAAVPGSDAAPEPAPHARRSGSARAAAERAPDRGAPGASVSVPIHTMIHTTRPVEVWLESLSHGKGPLHVQDLRSSGPDARRLRGAVAVEQTATATRITVRTPPDCDPADYRAAIVDAEGVTRGTLCVRVLE
jgi:hypothetical protein